MDGYREVGKLGKPHGTKGALKVQLREVYKADALKSTILFTDQDGHPFPYFIESWEGAVSIVVLEEVDSLEAAKKLSHQPVFLPEANISATEAEAEDDLDAWLSFSIADDEQGLIGEITEVVELREQLIAVVFYHEREVLVPLHEDLIIAVDPDNKLITMDLPEGLLNIEQE